MQERVISGSPTRALGLVLIGVLMTSVCAWILTLPNLSLKGAIAGWVGTPFFGLATLAAAVQIVKPVRLVLTQVGFEYSPFWRRPVKVAWRDLEPLFVWRYRSTALVVYRFVEGRRPAGWLSINRSFGMDGSFSNTLPMKADDLAKLMNGYRTQALAGAEAA